MSYRKIIVLSLSISLLLFSVTFAETTEAPQTSTPPTTTTMVPEAVTEPPLATEASAFSAPIPIPISTKEVVVTVPASTIVNSVYIEVKGQSLAVTSFDGAAVMPNESSVNGELFRYTVQVSDPALSSRLYTFKITGEFELMDVGIVTPESEIRQSQMPDAIQSEIRQSIAEPIDVNPAAPGALDFGISSSAVTTEISGSITPTLLEFTVPTQLTFSIDPNSKDPFSSPVYLIENKTFAPIEVIVKDFSLKEDSYFTFVAPDHYPSWENLSVSESKNIALALFAYDNTQWMDVKKPAYWGGTIPPEGEVLGVLPANGIGAFKFTALHGRAFPSGAEITCNLTLLIRIKP